MNIRLSVVIPGYNTPVSQWQRCVSSVLKACSPNDEVLCVDDGSDLPVEASQVFADMDNRVRLFRKQNGGLSSARNYALERIRGRYVTFVDSDDEIKEETYDKCVENLEHCEADIAIYAVDVIWVRERLHKVDQLPYKYYGELTAKDIQEIFNAELLNYACNKVYRVEFIMGTGSALRESIMFNSDGMPCEDIIFNLECIINGAKWVTVNYVGYLYYRAGESLLSRYKKTNTRGYELCKDAWIRCYNKVKDGERTVIQKNCDLYTDRYIAKMEWKNIWLPGSPYSIAERFRWCLKSRHIENKLLSFIKMMIFTFCRRYLYFLPIRKWHIRRLNPTVIIWEGF